MRNNTIELGCRIEAGWTTTIARVTVRLRSEARNQCYFASDRLKFGTLPQRELTLLESSMSYLRRFPVFSSTKEGVSSSSSYTLTLASCWNLLSNSLSSITDSFSGDDVLSLCHRKLFLIFFKILALKFLKYIDYSTPDLY